MWISAAGGRYPDLLILCDVLNRPLAAFWRVPHTAGKIFYLSIESFPNSHQRSIFNSNTYFYIGKQQASVAGSVGHSDIKQFKQHLTQTGHNLRCLYLRPDEPSSLPGKYVLSLQFSSFLHPFLRNRPPQEPPPSVATVRLLF